mgnify:CR=1 FL=1
MSRNEPYTRLCGGDWQSARPLAPFDGGVMAFLSDLGAALIADREARAYPDVVAFGFFCRRANLEALAREYEGAVSDRLGRGISFHIAPSNVPVNFAYSLAAGLLAALDSALGGYNARVKGNFRLGIFLSGTVGNAAIAAFLTWLGQKLGIPLYLAAVVVFGTRMFQNFAEIRRELLTSKQKRDKIEQDIVPPGKGNTK